MMVTFLFCAAAVVGVIGLIAGCTAAARNWDIDSEWTIAGIVGAVCLVISLVFLAGGGVSLRHHRIDSERQRNAQATLDLANAGSNTGFKVIEVKVSENPVWRNVGDPMTVREGNSHTEVLEDYAIVRIGPCSAKYSVFPSAVPSGNDSTSVVYEIAPLTGRAEPLMYSDDDKPITENPFTGCSALTGAGLDKIFGIEGSDSSSTPSQPPVSASVPVPAQSPAPTQSSTPTSTPTPVQTSTPAQPPATTAGS